MKNNDKKAPPLSRSQQSKKERGLCVTAFCRKKYKDGNYCYTCTKRKYAEKHPIKYCYQTTKNNARRRGKSFSLTIEEFTKIVMESGYIEHKGRKPHSLTLDRIKNEEGYHYHNIRVITNAENVYKENYIDYAPPF